VREGWIEKELIEVTDFIDYRGRTPKKTESGIKLITAKNVRMGYLKNNPEEFINEDAYDDWMTRGIPQKGDVLFTTEAPLANVALLDTEEKIALAQRIITLCPDRDILNGEYLTYCIQSPEMQYKILEKGTGATVTGIKSRVLKKVKIPIPPLPEQKRIVDILDEAFEAIDQAKANIEQNIQNAEELFQSKLNEIFLQKGDGWEEKRLGDLTYVSSGGTPKRSTSEYWKNGTIAWYSSGELNDLFTKDPERHITSIGLDESNAKLFPKGSLLIGMYDTAALKMSILEREGTFNQAISGVKPTKELNLQFVMYAINSIKPVLMKQRRGVRQKNLNLTKIKAISIPCPNIAIQNEVVSQLGELKENIDSLKDTLNCKLVELIELKKSILQKAFSGELTRGEAGLAGFGDEWDELVAKAAEPEVKYNAEE